MPILGTIASSRATTTPLVPGSPTYTYLGQVNATTGDTTMTFSSISGSYQDLLVRLSGRDSVSAIVHNIALRFNGDSGNNYDGGYLYQDGTTIGGGEEGPRGFQQGTYVMGSTSRADAFSIIDIYIYDYTNTGRYKTVIFDNGMPNNNSVNGGQGYWSAIWNSNSAITQIQFTEIDGANYTTGTNAYLYGIKKS